MMLVSLELDNISFLRKTNGKKYAEGTSTIKEAVFPFPAETDTFDKVENSASEAGVVGAQEGINLDLQARLHNSNTQLELANMECVRQGQEIDSLAREKDESQERIRNLERQNAAMRRRVEELENGGKLPRPGPSLKPFEELTPRQQKIASNKLRQQLCQTSEERRIQPTKLSAYLTCRFVSIYCILISVFIIVSSSVNFIFVSQVKFVQVILSRVQETLFNGQENISGGGGHSSEEHQQGAGPVADNPWRRFR